MLLTENSKTTVSASLIGGNGERDNPSFWGPSSSVPLRPRF